MSSETTYLPPVASRVYTYDPEEPQYVTSKQPVPSRIYLDSKDTVYGTDRTNCTISTGNQFALGVNRTRVLGITALWYIPNVNPRNNTIRFFSSVSGLFYTVTLDVRYYDINVPADIVALVNDITVKLNGPASGISFAITADPGFPRQFTITGSAPYYIDPACSAVAKGAPMYGFEILGALSLTTRLGPMSMMYTQYVDIKSSTLTKWEKIRSVTSGQQNPVIMRAFIGGNSWGEVFHIISTYQAFSWKASDPIYSIDVSFYDENGDPLYCPNDGKDFRWQLALGAEL